MKDKKEEGCRKNLPAAACKEGMSGHGQAQRKSYYIFRILETHLVEII